MNIKAGNSNVAGTLVVRSRRLPTIVAEVLGYAVASAVALLVDVLLLWWLTTHGLNYLLAASISFTAGGIVAWWLSTRYVFHSHRVHNRRAELALFLVIGCVGLAINASVLFAAVQYFGLSLPMAKASAIGLTFASNYLLRRFALFTSSRRPPT